MKELFVIANEKIYSNKNIFFCENKDIQSIVNFLALNIICFLYPEAVILKNLFN
jgi:hypothetical protein